MSTSEFCIQQRKKEQQQLKKLLIFGFAGSAILHGILAYALPRWSLESPKQVQKPMEVIIVEKPKPEPKPISKPKPKVESKPIVEPPKPLPEPVEAQTPPPKPVPAPAPEPVKAQTPPPKPVPAPEPKPLPLPEPAPKKVLTAPTPAPSQPIVSAPVKNTAQPSSLSSSVTAPSSSASAQSSSNNPGVPGSVVATNSAPPRPDTSEPSEGISCVSNCEPEYPAALEGVEGSAGIKLTIDRDGNVIGAELADADSNTQVNRQALLAARQMQFSSPGESSASVQVKINFTVEGSQYDRARREEQEKREQAEKESQEQEAARQQQLEAEQQAKQEQLERERQAREQQLQQQQQTPPPAPEVEPTPKLPVSPEELDEERLRKFQQRMEQY